MNCSAITHSVKVKKQQNEMGWVSGWRKGVCKKFEKRGVGSIGEVFIKQGVRYPLSTMYIFKYIQLNPSKWTLKVNQLF